MVNKSTIQAKFEASNDRDNYTQDNQQFDLLRSIRRVAYLKQRGAEDFFELGKELLHVKQNLKHGEWLKFLRVVDISQSTAWRCRSFAMEVQKAQSKDSNYSPANNFNSDEFWGHTLKEKGKSNSGLGLLKEIKAARKKLQRLLQPLIDMDCKCYEHAPAEVVDGLNKELSAMYTLIEVVLTRRSKQQVCAMCGRERDGDHPDGWMTAPLAIESLCPHCQPTKEMNLLMTFGYLPEQWKEMKAECQAGLEVR